MPFTEADHPRTATGLFSEKVQSAPETSLATGAVAALAAGIKPGVPVVFRESGVGIPEPGYVAAAVPPTDSHPSGGEFMVSLSGGGDVIAWWTEIEVLEGPAADVALAAMTPSQLAAARILVERAQVAHQQTRRELEKVSVDAARTALSARFPAGSTVEMFKPYDQLNYTLSRVLDVDDKLIWSAGPGSSDQDIMEINGYLAAGGGRTVAAFKRLNSQLGSYLEVTI